MDAVTPVHALLDSHRDDDGEPSVDLAVGVVSLAGSDPGAKKRANQDAHSSHPRGFASTSGAFFAVYDGHGPNGHHVARLLRERLPGRLVEDAKTRAALARDPPSARASAFRGADADLASSAIDCELSGAAAAAVHLRGLQLTTAWVGDCRAVLGREENGVMSASALTRDHRPDDPAERARVEKAGGRVAKILDGLGDDGKPAEVGPPRVWRRDAWVPGLAMSRSMGDGVARALGVVADPSSDVRTLEARDRFVILASDGVWEHCSNEEAVMLVAACDGPEEAAKKVAGVARARWEEFEGGGVADDITVVVVAFSLR